MRTEEARNLDDKTIQALLSILYLVTRLPLLGFLPLVRDEALYSMMISEQFSGPTIVPTLFGYFVSWKPALFFWVYAFLSRLPFSLEVSFRFPSLLFGLATIPVLYGILKNIGASRNLAFLSCAIFILSFASFYPNTAVLTDTLNLFLISCSLYLYTDRRLGDRRFLAAGALAFAAFFIKLVVAIMAPLLALAFFFIHDRKTMMKPLFLVSLLAVPGAFVLHYLLLDSLGLAEQLFLSDIGGHLVSGGFKQIEVFRGSITMFMIGVGIWFMLSLAGLWKHWRENPFMASWYLLIVFPLITGNFMIWYYLPVMPPLSYFAALALLKWDGREKADRFFFIVFALLSISSLAITGALYITLHDVYLPLKEAGLLLAGKPDVLIYGTYSSEVVAYKMLTEQDSSVGQLDFGWITGQLPEDHLHEYLRDYDSERYPIISGSFTAIFTEPGPYRKDSNVTDFRYVAITGLYDADIPGSSLIYNQTEVQVYEIR